MYDCFKTEQIYRAIIVKSLPIRRKGLEFLFHLHRPQNDVCILLVRGKCLIMFRFGIIFSIDFRPDFGRYIQGGFVSFGQSFQWPLFIQRRLHKRTVHTKRKAASSVVSGEVLGSFQWRYHKEHRFRVHFRTV